MSYDELIRSRCEDAARKRNPAIIGDLLKVCKDELVAEAARTAPTANYKKLEGKTTPTEQKFAKKPDNGVWCTFCKLKGHAVADCRKKGPANRNGTPVVTPKTDPKGKGKGTETATTPAHTMEKFRGKPRKWLSDEG